MNYYVFQIINNWAGKYDWIDDIIEVFAKDIVWIMIAVLAYLWFSGKEENQKLVFYSFLSTSFSLFLASILISPAVNHARPFVEHHVLQLIPHVPDSSFPSDHATLAFSLAFSILFVKRKLGLFMLILAIVTGISRIYVGVHYPGDIVGAIALSFIISNILHLLKSHLDVIPLIIIRTYRKMLQRIIFVFHK